jgi:hypothetical protein
MLKIVSIVLVVLMIIGGVLFVRRWNSTTPWGTGTGTIPREKVGLVLPHQPLV